MKKFIITEEEKNNILDLYVNKKILTEQRFKSLAKFFGGTVDDIIKYYGDDAAKTMENVFAKLYSRSGNLISKAEGSFIVSASGLQLPFEQVQKAIKLVGAGLKQPQEVLDLLPRYLADGSEFRAGIKQAMENKSLGQVGAQIGKQLSQFESKFLLKNCSNMNFCDTRTIVSDLFSKLNNVAKLTEFIPSKVKILEKSNVAGREIINVALEDGTEVLFYKSSGANVATTGKEAGEWFVIPGFAENGWFFKTMETINLTKGGNKYLTDMAEYLKYNGTDLLGK